MAPRTMSQIAGEFGLSRNSTADPFAKSEQATLDIISQQLSEFRSQAVESQSARGFGRSTFDEAVLRRQETDVLGQVGSQFAQARTTDDLRERDFERGLLTRGIEADITTDQLLPAQTAAERELIGARGGEQRLTLADQLAGDTQLTELRGDIESGLLDTRGDQSISQIQEQVIGEEQLIGTRGEEQRTTLAAQLAGTESQIAQEAGERRTTAEFQSELVRGLLPDQTASEQALIESRGAEQRQGITAQAAAESPLISQRGEEQRLTLQDQIAGSLEQVQADIAGKLELTSAGGVEDRLTVAERFQQEGFLSTQRSVERINEINADATNKLTELRERFSIMRESLPEELRLKADAEVRVLEKQIEVEREATIIDMVINTTVGYMASIFSTGTTLAEASNKIIDDAANLLFGGS